MHKNHSYLYIPMVLAVLSRGLYMLWDIPDFWGDSYHNWFISALTLENDWLYSDYKGRELVWLPVYRYVLAGVMFIFPNQDGLMLASSLNSMIAVITVGILSYQLAQVRTKQVGMWAGIVLALLPWHIAYSTMNLPNIFGGLLLLVVVLQVIQAKWYWVILLTMIGVLTRYEITYALMVVGVFTLFTREWKLSLALFIGAIMGLSIWSYWSMMNTGDPLYWITTKSAGLSWDAFFQTVVRGDKRSLFEPILSIIQALPIILVLFLPKWIDKDFRSWKNHQWHRFLPLALVLFQVIFLMIGQYFYFSAANPRYYIILLPLGVYAIFSLIRTDWFEHDKLTRFIVCIGLLIISIQIASFYYKGQVWTKFAEAGIYIQNLDTTSHFWIDEPAIIYHSSLPLKQVHSSDQLVEDEWNNPDQIVSSLITNRIRYIVSFEASYSKTLWIWPEMKEALPFEWKGLTFEPVYRFSVDSQDATHIHEQLVQFAQSRFGPVTVWRVNY